MNHKIFAVADIHAGRSMQNAIPAFREDYVKALQSLATAIVNDPALVKYVILAGDVFDSPKVTGSCMEAFKDFLTTILDESESHQTMVLYIQGNHDRQDPNDPSSVPLVEACTPSHLKHLVHHLSAKPVVYGPKHVKISGLDYAAPEQIKEQLRTIEATDILVLHQPMEEFLGFEGSFDLSSEDIPEQVGNVIVGDVHVACMETLGNGGHLLSPGALHACTIGQIGHGWWDLTTWTFHDIPTRNIVRVNVETLTELTDLVPEIVADLETVNGMLPVIDFKVRKEHEEAVQALKESLDGKVIVLKSSVVHKREAFMHNEQVPESEQRLTLIGALPFVLNVDKEGKVYRLCEECLTGDISLSADAFVREQLKAK